MLQIKKGFDMLRILYCFFILFIVTSCIDEKKNTKRNENKKAKSKYFPIIPYSVNFKLDNQIKIKVFYGTFGEGNNLRRSKMLVYIDDGSEKKPELCILDDGTSLIEYKGKKYKSNLSEIVFVNPNNWHPVVLAKSWDLSYTSNKKKLQKKLEVLLGDFVFNSEPIRKNSFQVKTKTGLHSSY
jgi:hypothetical protein